MTVIGIEAGIWKEVLTEAVEELAATMGVEARTLETSGTPRDTLAGAHIALVGNVEVFQAGVAAEDESASSIARLFLGMEDDEAVEERDVVDSLCELVNIIAGGIKSRVIDVDPTLKLGLPLCSRGKTLPSDSQQEIKMSYQIGEAAVDFFVVWMR